MPSYLYTPGTPSVPIVGETSVFPVRRIYCVGRNYAEHVREMGIDPKKSAPFFFGKPADAVIGDGATVPYPSRTQDFQHEVELVVAIGRAGRNIPVTQALGYVYGYAVGCDYTRRDLQRAAKETSRPWDAAKGFDASAGVSAIQSAARVGHPARGRIWLTVNGVLKQQGDIADMIWGVPAIIAELSTLFAVHEGDLIYTGTPAGVGALASGDLVTLGVAGLATLEQRIGSPL